MKRLALVPALVLAALMASAAMAGAQASPQFKLGFKALADLIPEVVGDPLEVEHYGPNGDSLQRTSGGLMVWRKADNWTAFTNGSITWINGPHGLASRLNSQLFEWEQPAAPATPPPPQVSPGLILYQADWSAGLDGWSPAPGWTVQGGLLANNGSTQSMSLVSPFQPPVANYAVQAEIQIVSMGQYRNFALLARDGYLGGLHSWNYSNTRQAFLGTTTSRLVMKDYDPGAAWHTYRLEVSGNRVRLLVDGIVMTEVSDNRLAGPGRVGLWNQETQINVRSFKVIAL